MVPRNAIEIGIRWLTLSFYEPSKFYHVLGNFFLGGRFFYFKFWNSDTVDFSMKWFNIKIKRFLNATRCYFFDFCSSATLVACFRFVTILEFNRSLLWWNFILYCVRWVTIESYFTDNFEKFRGIFHCENRFKSSLNHKSIILHIRFSSVNLQN